MNITKQNRVPTFSSNNRSKVHDLTTSKILLPENYYLIYYCYWPSSLFLTARYNTASVT